LLTASERRMIAEWLDQGGQYWYDGGSEVEHRNTPCRIQQNKALT
jgi:hypothetical protein